jgi:hypothetical protein
MDQIRFLDAGSTIEFPKSPRSAMSRPLLFLLGFVPLYAPYDLLIRPAWPNGFSIGLLFVIVISAGAVLISVLFWAAAILGLNQYARFDATAGVFTYGYETGVTKYGERTILFAEIEEVSLKIHSWTDGPPSYSVVVKIPQRRKLNDAYPP